MSLKRPTTTAVKRAVKQIKNNPKYNANMGALDKLFVLFPENNKIEEVYLKVVALNELYSTNIYNPYKIATNIVKLDIDKDLKSNTLKIVVKIAKSHSLKTSGGTKWNFYSFATKYCSWHVAGFYPIYDSYVSAALNSYRKSHKFHEFKNVDLKDYKKFVAIMTSFMLEFDLQDLSLREVDNFLWKKGKEIKNKVEKIKSIS